MNNEDQLSDHFQYDDQNSTSRHNAIQTSTHEKIERLSQCIDTMREALIQLQIRLDKMQEKSEKPTGCGFSCSNNSLSI